MRYIQSVVLILSALAMPAVAHAADGASSGKGAKGVPVASTSTTEARPKHEAAPAPSTSTPVRQPKSAAAQSWVVITPRLPDQRESASPSPAPREESASHSISITGPNGRLARVTAYWPSEGDYYTRHNLSSTGVRLHEGHCAVDPTIIPYGSVVNISGVGQYVAVDTGTAVVERTAAREAGHTSAERNAIVIDVFFENRSQGEAFASGAAKWAPITWWTPGSSQAKDSRNLLAEEDWQKIQSKQL